MTLYEIIDNAGYSERFLETAQGERMAKAAQRFNVSDWEPETGDQVGVSFKVLWAVAEGTPFDRLHCGAMVSRDRKHAFADAMNIC